MWKSVYEMARTLLHLSEHVQEDRQEIGEIRKDLRDLTLAVERLQGQVAHVGEREARERAILLLRLENGLLRGRALMVGEGDTGG